MAIEYRVCWRADTNINFKGATDWSEWGGFEESVEEAEKALLGPIDGGQLPQGLEEALAASGFDWWPEVRVVEEVAFRG